MSDTAMMMMLSIITCVIVCMLFVGFFVFTEEGRRLRNKIFNRSRKNDNKLPSPATNGSENKSTKVAPVPQGQWTSATATHYASYPSCCKNSPNKRPIDKSECTDYSGCKYQGEFSGLERSLSYDQVRSRNIVSFFDAAHQGRGKSKKEAMSWWEANVKGKRIEIKNPDTGKTMIVEALDTCGDWDCGGCCTKEANKHGGFLIDIEEHTGDRFWAPAPLQDERAIQWRWV